MRRVLVLLLVVGLLAAGVLLWAGRQARGLPGWYLEARQAGTLDADLVAAGGRAQQELVGRFGRELLDEVTADDGTPDESFLDRIKRRGKMVLDGLRKGRELRLDERDLERLLLAWASDDDAGRELLAAARAVRAEILGDELELGVVVAPDALPPALLAASQRRLLTRLAALAGSDGELYVAVRAAPAAVDERLRLGPPLALRVGRLELGPRLLAALGAGSPELADGLAVDVGRMKVREARIDGEVLVLTVSPQI